MADNNNIVNDNSPGADKYKQALKELEEKHKQQQYQEEKARLEAEHRRSITDRLDVLRENDPNMLDTVSPLRSGPKNTAPMVKNSDPIEPGSVYDMTYINRGLNTGRQTGRPLSDINTQLGRSNYDLEALLRSRGIYSREFIERGLYNNFNRFGYNGFIDPYNIPTVTKEYIFFTKPDLNILTKEDGDPSGVYQDLNKNLLNYPFFTDAYSRYRAVLEDLCQSHSVRKSDQIATNSASRNAKYNMVVNNIAISGDYLYYNKKSNFIPLLSNTLVSTIPLPDRNAEYVETNGNVYGTKMRYRDRSTGNKNFTFSLEFQDTRFYDVYMFFRIYDEYITLKNLGIVSPKNRQIWRKILHDQFSIYKITVDEDGTTITHFAKYTGVFPTSVPSSMFSDMNSVEPKGRLSVEFNCFEVEDMNPYILREFNSVSSSPLNGINNLMALPECELYDTNHDHSNGDWPKYPYIYWDRLDTSEGSKTINTSNSGPRKYFLRWKYGDDTDAMYVSRTQTANSNSTHYSGKF